MLFVIGSSMYVCICSAVTEREVRDAIERGARTVDAVARACCAGDDCGGCRGVIEEMIEEHAARAVRLPMLQSGLQPGLQPGVPSGAPQGAPDRAA
jgi:bacterioferritin-associated ferredoxin